MAELSRRGLFGTTAAGLAGLGIARAEAATLPSDQPAALFGSVSQDRVILPPLHDTSTDSDPPTLNSDPVKRRLGVAVVGLGHLALNQILPGFGRAKSVRVTALVSGERDKGRAVAAQYGVPETHLYDYASFDKLRDNPDVDIVYIVLPNAMHMEYTLWAAEAASTCCAKNRWRPASPMPAV
jgi:Oxidoreductase family, NAD-binding Rossmann fold